MGGSGYDIEPRKVDQQRRVVLPSEVLDALGVEPGGYVTFEVDGRDVRVVKVNWVTEKGRR